MKAFHIIDTAPKRKLGEEYHISDYDVLCQVISAMSWKKTNGEIELVADAEALSALGGLVRMYDSVKPLPSVDEIDNIAFWAAGKLYALGEQNCPCVMLDTDFIVWDKLDFEKGITVAHREAINEAVYPSKKAFNVSNYQFYSRWSWSELPCNTAFAYFDDNDFKNYYVNRAKEFMRACKRCDNVLTYMVFAEQRLLAMCAQEKNVEINALMDYNSLGESKKFTHLWGYKQILRENSDERDKFCRRCATRIIKDYPECVAMLQECRQTAKYFQRG